MASKIFAQDSTLKYNASIMLSGASAATPFWIQANQNGTIPNSGNFGTGQFGVYKIYNPNNPRILQWSAGAELIASYGTSTKLFASDLYVASKIGHFEILAGQKKHMTGLADTLLTSGSLSVSGNSRPIPRLQIAMPEFYPLFFTNDFISIKASYSDGLSHGTNINYGSTRHIPQTYFHQKTLYFRIGNDHQKLVGFAGINHQAIWGGEGKIAPLYEMKPIQAYWYTITGKTFNYTKIGNHFGTIDLGLQWKRKEWSYFIYRQNIYESGSLFKVINFTDGLNGLSIKRNKSRLAGTTYFQIRSILLEVVGTKDQTNSNPFSGISLFEKGNYYNNYIYQNGWSFYGRNMGTPLAGNKNDTKPDTYSSVSEFTNNNRFWAFHIGATASWLNAEILFKATYSRNFGTYINPFDVRKDQISILLNVEKNYL
ncbi:capsule assembly Wzi family protein [Dyadobacter sp. NIV53]|uniref:capsule assembly Wzi family protein n=1 Tax=Dyadobacter sp. NIV53 TaxID=2861765 RepID=UPI001E50020E|nr:capsule assembly Wzi family protein [Dyadobacter sp. NIV53]